ncbi:hypothetical protein lerEdw1_000912 [Lerista edwardsae]|nr:hypothetical protein lerEdw1_000912 [Lerista edwardsae]
MQFKAGKRIECKMEKNQKTQCDMKTDLNLLLECVKYQMDHPASQKEALITIYSICQENSDASDYFREIGGLMFVHNLAKSSTQSAVREASLFALGGLAENNESGQTCVRESGCLEVLLQLFRTTLSVSEVSMLDQNINQYHLWSSVCSALCACVNNPQNEDNQSACSLVFPHAKYWLQSCMKPEIIRPICSFIGLTVANNSRIQHFFASIGGLAVLDEVLVKLIHNSSGNYSNTKLAVVVTKTLDACIADNLAALGVTLSRYNIVPNLLTLLSYNILDSGEKFSVILALGHCTDGCAEKLSLKSTERSFNMDNVEQMKVDQQNRERMFEDYQDKAKEILYRIEQLENEYQKEICSEIQTLESRGSNHQSYPVNKVLCCLQCEEQKQKRSASVMSCNRSCERSKNEEHKLHQDDKIGKQLCNMAPEQSPNNPRQLNVTDEVIPTKYAHGLAKNELLKAAIGNATKASVSQSGHGKLLHSAAKLKTIGINKGHITNKSTGCESSKSDVQARDVLFKRPDFVVGRMTQQVQSTGCLTTGLSLNSRNFSKMLQSCKYLCEQHKVILEIETKYKRKLSRPVACEDTSTDADLQTIQDTCLKKHPIKWKNCFKDQDLSKNHAYSLDEDQVDELHLSNIPEIAFKKQRRTRKDFTSEEISYLLEGVGKMGHHWNSILWSYPFQKGRTNVDLAKKYCKLQRNEKNKNI